MKALDFIQKNSAGQTLIRERWLAARFRSLEFKIGVEVDFWMEAWNYLVSLLRRGGDGVCGLSSPNSRIR